MKLSSILAILITHDHYDHIKSAGWFGEKLNIPVYATSKVHEGIANNRLIRHQLNGSAKFIEKEKQFIIKDLRITPFDVPHDSNDNVGYFLEFGSEKMTLVTDVGTITDQVAHYVSKATQLIIESNYDEEMLLNGGYPWHLKQRITCGRGHLSNRQTAEFLADNFPIGLKNIWLCHLSGDNNSPDLAYNTMKRALSLNNIEVTDDVSLHVLERNKLSPKIYF